MKKILPLVILAAIALGGYYYFQTLKNGPKGALAQAAAAVEAHDMTKFEQYVDVNSLTSHLVDDVVSQGSAITSLVPGGSLGVGLAMRFLKPALAKGAHNEVQRYVETGSLEGSADGEAGSPKRPLVSLAGLAGKVVSPETKFKGIKYSREEGDNAYLGIELTQPKYDTTMVVELKMRRVGESWKAVQIMNTRELLQNAARLEKRRLVGGE